MSFGKKLPVIAMVVLLAACGSPEKRAADYMAKAQQLYAAGDYAKARLEAQNALQVEPKNAKVSYLLAEIAEQQKLYQEMFGHLSSTRPRARANRWSRKSPGRCAATDRTADGRTAGTARPRPAAWQA